MTNKLPTGIRYISNAYRWEARYNNKRVTGSAYNLADAIKNRQSAIDKLKTGTYSKQVQPIIKPTGKQKNDCPTLQQAINHTMLTDWKECKSLKSIEINCRLIMQYFDPKLQLCDITTQMLDDYVIYLQNRGNKAGTINRKLSILSKLLHGANRKERLERMPCIDRLPEHGRRIRYITPEEEETIIKLFDTWGYNRMARMVELLIDTGIRCGELKKLSRGDIVEQGINGVIYLHETKNGDSRAVPLTSKARIAFDYLAKTSTNTNVIYCEYDGYITKAWNKLRAAMELNNDPCFVPHILRHTCCTRLVQKGAPLKKVQLWMGHKSIQTTMRYAHLYANDIYNMVDLLEA